MIDRATVDRIIDAAQIVDVVSDFVTLRKSGANYKGLCPFHNERTPSFVVSPAKNYCKCFSCGKGGNPVHFIMEHEQMTFPEALRYLAKKYSIEIQERELSDEEKRAQSERESMFVVNEWAAQFFQDTLYNTVDGQAVGMAYFHSRGFRDDTIKAFQLGYCPAKGNATYGAAKAKGFKDEFLEKTGICYRKDSGQLQDRYWGRVIFPVHSLSGKVVAFGGRVLDAATKGVKVKYVNSPESEIYHKSNELYGIYQAKQAIVKQGRCFLVEGYTDVISMHQSGVENVVASSGTSLTPGQIRMIHRFTENITVLYDGDAAGIKASIRGIDLLLEEGMNVKVLLLPDGDDPDSFARKHNATEYQAYIEANQVDFIRFKTNLLRKDAGDDPIKRAEIIGSLVKSISVIPDAIVRSVYIKECGQTMEVDEQLLVDAVAKLKRTENEERNKRRFNAAQRAENEVKSMPPTLENVPVPPIETPDFPPAEFAPPATPDAQETPPPTEENAPVPTNVPRPSYIPQTGMEEQLFYQKELLLVQLLVRYGEKNVFNMEDDAGNAVPLSVADYIKRDLDQDGLQFHTALHLRVLDEVLAHEKEAGFVAETYFLNHTDTALSHLAFELSVDRYELSKYHSKNQKIVTDEDRLEELVTHLMIDYKYAVVSEELKQILLKLRDPAVLNDDQQCAAMMRHYKEIKDVECVLAKHLGERVITP